MKVKGIWESGKAFRIKGHSSDYEVFTSPKDENLKKVAARPMEMILNGVVGCMGATITTIIRHHMNQIDNFEISACCWSKSRNRTKRIYSYRYLY